MYRLPTREVRIGNLLIGAGHPVRIQTMTTTDTLDVEATVAQTIRCIEAGAELVRITAPSKKEAEALAPIKDRLEAAGYTTPLVADIHFTPNAAEIAAGIVEKVRINPGNYIDKKKFDFIEYTDADYAAEVHRIKERFTPLVRLCKTHGTAMRIGTNHGSLSDRIMSRYGDTAVGMVESAMEFLRIARGEDFHQIVLSMKSSNPIVMVEAYRLLVQTMTGEFGECYPLHLGVTEAGDGEDGRIKSAIGIGTLLQEGIGDTIRVSLTEDPEAELPVCKDLLSKVLPNPPAGILVPPAPLPLRLPQSLAHGPVGGGQVPVVVADLSREAEAVTPAHFESFGYRYDAETDKWRIADGAADFVFLGNKRLSFEVPGTLRPVVFSSVWKALPAGRQRDHLPLFSPSEWREVACPVPVGSGAHHPVLNFLLLDVDAEVPAEILIETAPLALVLHSKAARPATAIKDFLRRHADLKLPVVFCDTSLAPTADQQLIDFSVTCGSLFLDGLGDGLWLLNSAAGETNTAVSGRTYSTVKDDRQFLNNTAFSILQATRKRISKTEYISCPSCGRTLFELQETTAKIRAATHHLKGLKIAIMGCIVNGPGEMADADFGYVGSGVGKITLYKSKEVVRRNVDSEVAVEALIDLLKEHDAWVEPEA